MTPEVVALYETIARLSSLALQHGAPIEGVGGMLLGLKFDPRGPVTGHDRIKFCSSPTGLLGRHLLIDYAGRDDLRPTRGGTRRLRRDGAAGVGND